MTLPIMMQARRKPAIKTKTAREGPRAVFLTQG